jgi:O-antigen ligase
VSLLVVSVLLLPRKISAVLLLTILVSGFAFSDFAYNHLRFDRLTSFSYDTLNTFTSYRLEDYVATYELFWRKPLGHGFGNSVQILMEEYQQDTELHNVWLRLLADGGLLLLASMLSVVGYVLRKNFRSLRHDVLRRLRANINVPNVARDRQRILVVSLAILLAGLTVSMFAPRAPIGAFQNSAMWWAAAGVVIGVAEVVRQRPSLFTRKAPHLRSRVRSS